jgi:imidazolonepropionase-like amidohydrolase
MFPIPPGAQVVDLGDATILPRFIDAHTHVTDEGSDGQYESDRACA